MSEDNIGNKKRNILTFESLFDLYHREKSTSQLNNIDPLFLDDIFSYLKQKRSFIESIKKKSDMLSQSQLLNMEKQFSNAVRLLKDLLDRRQRKIIDLALNKVRTQSTSIESGAMHPYEEQFYYAMYGLLSSFKSNIIDKLLVDLYQGTNEFSTDHVLEKTDSILKLLADNSLAEYVEVSMNFSDNPALSESDHPEDNLHNGALGEELDDPDFEASASDSVTSDDIGDVSKIEKDKTSSINDTKNTAPASDDASSSADAYAGYSFTDEETSGEAGPIQVKIVKDVDKFIGGDLEVYGPYKADESVIVPSEIAALLVNKELAMKIN